MKLKSINWYMVVLHLFLVGLAAQVLYLAKQNNDLRAAMQGPSGLEAGDEVKPFEAVSMDGQQSKVSYDNPEKDTLLLVFTTTCPACKANQDNWRELYTRVGDQYRIVGVSVDPRGKEATIPYIEEYQLPYEVVLPADAQGFPREYKVVAVPQTLLNGKGGKVKESWVGAIAEQVIESLDKGGKSVRAGM